MPILVFTLIVVFVMLGYAIVGLATGSGVLAALGWGLALATLLEAGYLFTHGILYCLYTRRASGTRSSQKIQSKYTTD
ncbi:MULTISPECIES: hypothetical protein [unclassified Rhizobium]|uniref:hypothetical protein n=1 Tax=unclassified Rhizobium TaxID=2613769 RepID=UPI001FD8D2A9|nr:MULTISPECIES: hypothetical protein [unclassified Rhizobium]